MAAREKIQIDGQDLIEYSGTLIDYQEPLTASPKDGGGLDLDGIDGIVGTNSDLLSFGKGSIEIMFKGQSEEFVLEKKRRFVNWVRQKDFRQYVVETNPGFYRMAKLVSEKSREITEGIGEATGFFTFELLFQDAYEYELNNLVGFERIENIYDSINYVDLSISNKGSKSSGLKLTVTNVSADASESGEWGIYLIPFISQSHVPKLSEAIEVIRWGEVDKYLLAPGDSWIVDMSYPNIQLGSSVKGFEDKLTSYRGGQFFNLPQGNFILRFVSITNSLDSQSPYPLPFTVAYSFVTKYQ